jgi:hypothetical protein
MIEVNGRPESFHDPSNRPRYEQHSQYLAQELSDPHIGQIEGAARHYVSNEHECRAPNNKVNHTSSVGLLTLHIIAHLDLRWRF